MKILDAGIEGFYQVVELVDPPDGLRIHDTLSWIGSTWRIESIARRTRPQQGGVCVRVRLLTAKVSP